MKRMLITGMSGTGKSSVVEALSRRGHAAIDTDSDTWCEWKMVAFAGGPPEQDWVWREEEMTALLRQERHAPLFVSGCKSNQGQFYGLFNVVVLLSAPTAVLLNRVAARTTNPYGKTQEERARIIDHIETVEPLLRATCDMEFDTSALTVERLADELIRYAGTQKEGRGRRG